MPPVPILTIRNLSAVFPDNNGGLRVLENISFDVYPREFVCVLGPSGSGKTTLLRILAGLISPTSGSFMFGHGEQPGTGMVFQQANLMPWRTVIENIKLPLEVKQIEESRARMKAHALIDLVGLQGFEDSLPRDLSGGMAQRVAIAGICDNHGVSSLALRRVGRDGIAAHEEPLRWCERFRRAMFIAVPPAHPR